MQGVLAAVAGPATLRTIRRGAVQLVSSFFIYLNVVSPFVCYCNGSVAVRFMVS
jgi:hypothetical protein